MKLLCISNLYQPYAIGGAERVAQILAESMVTRGHDVTVVTLGPEAGAHDCDLNGVKVRYIPIRNIYNNHFVKRPAQGIRYLWHALDTFNPVAGRDIGRLIDELQPDLVHSHNIAGFSSAAWSVIRRRHLPCVHTIHDYYLLCSRSTLFSGGSNCDRICSSCRMLSSVRRKIVTGLTAVIAVSGFVLELHERMIEGFRRIPIRRIIVNGCSAFGDAVGPNQNGKIRIGFLGRLTEWKGVSTLLEECERFNSGRKIEVLIGGDGPTDYVTKVREAYCNDTRIHFLGVVKPGDFFNKIDVLAVPSLWNDPCPLVVGEAISTGVPVLGARRGGIPGLIREGVDGFLYEPTISGEFAAVLERAIESGLVTGKRPPSPRWSTDHLTIPRMVGEYEDLYREVLDKSRGLACPIFCDYMDPASSE